MAASSDLPGGRDVAVENFEHLLAAGGFGRAIGLSADGIDIPCVLFQAFPGPSRGFPPDAPPPSQSCSTWDALSNPTYRLECVRAFYACRPFPGRTRATSISRYSRQPPRRMGDFNLLHRTRLSKVDKHREIARPSGENGAPLVAESCDTASGASCRVEAVASGRHKRP